MKDEEIWSCSVIISQQNIFYFWGEIPKIKEKLKFIKSSLFFAEPVKSDEEELIEFKFVPVILTAQKDVSDVRVFSLRNYLTELETFEQLPET